jgi:hypothetical protein
MIYSNMGLTDLSSGNNSRLDEVVLHELLEVEVGKVITLGEFKKLGELGISVDLATVGSILELVCADVVVDFLADGSAGKHGTFLLSEEKSKLIGDESWLNKARRGTVSGSTLSLLRSFLGSLELLGNRLLKSLELGLERADNRRKLVDLFGILRKSCGDLWLSRLTLNCWDSSNRLGNRSF